jgi:dihydropteroate synthase
MGIVNITPDSFFEKSRNKTQKEVFQRILQVIAEGADIIDLGAMSTRPNFNFISEEDEWDRFKPILEYILKNLSDKIFSIDTFRSEIAKRAVLDYGIDIINDISGGQYDKKMFETAALCNCPYILMHLVGGIEKMHEVHNYHNFIQDMLFYFSEKIKQLHLLGVSDIILDPGFGFSKTVDQNFELLNNIDKFHLFEMPVLVGISRKTMIWKYLNLTPNDALNGTSVLNTFSLTKGANILRVHDVMEARQCVDLWWKIMKS